MRRLRFVAAAGLLLAIGGCGNPPPRVAAAATPAAGARVLTPVPEETTTHPPAAAPGPRHARPAPKPSPSKHPSTDAGSGDAGSGDAGLDRFVAEVQKRLPAVALDRRDEEVEALGEQACDSLAAGESVTAVSGEISEQGVAAKDSRTLVTLAQTTACRGRPKV